MCYVPATHVRACVELASQSEYRFSRPLARVRHSIADRRRSPSVIQPASRPMRPIILFIDRASGNISMNLVLLYWAKRERSRVACGPASWPPPMPMSTRNGPSPWSAVERWRTIDYPSWIAPSLSHPALRDLSALGSSCSDGNQRMAQ